MKRKAIYAGYFNIPTNGHLWVIQEGARLFDEVVVAIGMNQEKTPFFPVEVRLALLQRMTEDLPNVSVITIGKDFLVRSARQIGARWLLRGMRSQKDFDYERSMFHVNQELEPDINSVYLLCPKNLEGISSSFVQSVIGLTGWLDVVKTMVPLVVWEQLAKQA